MRRFIPTALLTALVGLLLGAALAAAEPALGQSPGVALAAEDNSLAGALRGMAKMVAQPLMQALNGATGPAIKAGAGAVDQKKLDAGAAGDGGKQRIIIDRGGGGK